jgi:hypothetical protein
MVSGTYKSRDEAEAAATALQSKGISAAIIETRDGSLQQLVRQWQVIVPRLSADSSLDISSIETAT